MGTVNLVTNGQNQARSIKRLGVNENLTVQGKKVPAEVQQAAVIRRAVSQMPKGSNLSVTITNTATSGAAQAFVLFDAAGVAANRGSITIGADITFSTTFAGNASYTTLKEYLKGTHLGSLGTMFQFSNETMINTSAIRIWNGNIEDYNSKSLSNYLQLAKDNYANDQKILVVNSELYINNLFAISGSLAFGEQLTILFNVAEFSNF